MNVLKYVLWADGFFVIFPNLPENETDRYPTHEQMAQGHPRSEVVSAGFMEVDSQVNTVFCHGESNSLGISSRGEEDAVFFMSRLF